MGQDEKGGGGANTEDTRGGCISLHGGGKGAFGEGIVVITPPASIIFPTSGVVQSSTGPFWPGEFPH